ncbi:MAG: hypothetical protein HN351_04610 [Deltaproteobacteria bacterium]|nr:hypothetical protein [Deltaproteobacteria bacterium]
MQVTAKTIPDKQTGLERQIQQKEKQAVTGSKAQGVKTAEKLVDANGAERNETSQYLKVLSRIENLLIQEKLPDAAIDGFVGAIKKQLEAMSEADNQMLLKLPEAVELELKNVDELPELIKNEIRDQSKTPALLKLLRQPKFADLMRTDSKPAAQTYTAQSAQPSVSAVPTRINILDIPKVNQKPVLAAVPKTVDNSANRKSSGMTKLTA